MMIGLVAWLRRRAGRFDRRGTAAVEFALVILPFLLCVFGVLEFGRYMWTLNTLESASESASHYVYAHSTDSLSSLRGAMLAQVQAAATGLDTTRISVSTTTSALNTTNFIAMVVTYPFTFMSLVGVPAMTITVRATFPVE